MSGNNSLEKLMEAAEGKIDVLAKSNEEQIKLLTERRKIDAEKSKEAILNALNELQNTISSMAKICVDRTEKISSTLGTLAQEIQNVDGRMNSVKGAAGARLSKKHEYCEIGDAQRVLEESKPSKLIFDVESSTTDLKPMDFTVFNKVGINFSDELEDEVSPIVSVSDESMGFYSQLFVQN